MFDLNSIKKLSFFGAVLLLGTLFPEPQSAFASVVEINQNEKGFTQVLNKVEDLLAPIREYNERHRLTPWKMIQPLEILSREYNFETAKITSEKKDISTEEVVYGCTILPKACVPIYNLLYGDALISYQVPKDETVNIDPIAVPSPTEMGHPSLHVLNFDKNSLQNSIEGLREGFCHYCLKEDPLGPTLKPYSDLAVFHLLIEQLKVCMESNYLDLAFLVKASLRSLIETSEVKGVSQEFMDRVERDVFLPAALILCCSIPDNEVNHLPLNYQSTSSLFDSMFGETNGARLPNDQQHPFVDYFSKILKKTARFLFLKTGKKAQPGDFRQQWWTRLEDLFNQEIQNVNIVAQKIKDLKNKRVETQTCSPYIFSRLPLNTLISNPIKYSLKDIDKENFTFLGHQNRSHWIAGRFIHTEEIVAGDLSKLPANQFAEGMVFYEMIKDQKSNATKNIEDKDSESTSDIFATKYKEIKDPFIAASTNGIDFSSPTPLEPDILLVAPFGAAYCSQMEILMDPEVMNKLPDAVQVTSIYPAANPIYVAYYFDLQAWDKLNEQKLDVLFKKPD